MRIIVISFLLFITVCPLKGQVRPVTISIQPDGKHQLVRDGSPYFIRGAGGSVYLDRLAAYGGNSLRTWGTDENTIDLLDEAHSLGLTVCMGLWVGHQEHGFDYNNEQAVEAQLEAFREWVLRYKDHPAVLMWAIGNEVELGVSEANLNTKVWEAINDISEMIHEVDGNHPTLTVTASINSSKANQIAALAPDLDLLGVNAYGSIGGVHETVTNSDFDKPYIITEWGPNGQWEVPKTSWGAPVEQTSSEKADLYSSRYEENIASYPGQCLGSYVFLWGDKVEQTPTWYGLFFDSLETEGLDEMVRNWKGEYPENRAPRIVEATIEGQNAYDNVRVRKLSGNSARVIVEDENPELLTYEFLIQPENGEQGLIADETHVLPYLPGIIEAQENNQITFSASDNLQPYRLFIFVRDDAGNIAMANIPYEVNLDPLVSDDPSLYYPVKDSYVRDGEYSSTAVGNSDRLRLLTRLSDQVGFTRETIIGFNLSDVDKLSTSIKLSVYGASEDEMDVSVYGINSPWNENSVTFSSVRNLSPVALDTVTVEAGESYYEWDVTRYVNDQLALGNHQISFILRNLSVSPLPVQWNSREKFAQLPMLSFTFTDRSLVVGVEELIDAEINMYPNPATSSTHIRSQDGVSRVRIHTADGRLLKVVEPGNSQAFTIDTQAMPGGLYFVEIETLTGNILFTRLIIRN